MFQNSTIDFKLVAVTNNDRPPFLTEPGGNMGDKHDRVEVAYEKFADGREMFFLPQ